MIQNIIFDFGGVLLDLRPDRCKEEFHRLGIPEIDQMLSMAHQQGVLDEMERGKLTLPQFCDAMRAAHTGEFYLEERFRRLIPFMKNGHPIPAPTNRQIIQAFASMCDGIPAYKLDFIAQLRKEGYHVCALSNTNPVHWNHCLSYFIEAGYLPGDLFEHQWLSCELQMVKPDPEIFRYILADAGYEPSETLFVDDNQYNCDVAASLGIRTFCAPVRSDWTGQFRKYLL